MKLVESIEAGVAESVSCSEKYNGSVELWKKSSIPKFHRFRSYKLPEIVERYPAVPSNAFLWQMVAEKLYMSFLESLHVNRPKKPQRILSDVDKNAIRYAAGFVVRKLRRKFNKTTNSYSSCILNCLNHIICDPTDLDHPEREDVEVEDFEAYTKIWLQKTNRGGLLNITSDSFALFWDIEMVVYDKLLESFAGEKQSVAELTASTVKVYNIQFIWSVVSNMEEDDDEVQAQHLLSCIVEEWIVLRGHSLCNHYMEQYKRAVEETKKKSLRKELKRSEKEAATHK